MANDADNIRYHDPLDARSARQIGLLLTKALTEAEKDQVRQIATHGRAVADPDGQAFHYLIGILRSMCGSDAIAMQLLDEVSAKVDGLVDEKNRVDDVWANLTPEQRREVTR